MTISQGNGAVDRDQFLDEILADYLRAVKRGEAPDKRELLDRHPDLAPELAAFLADRDRFDRLAAPLRQALAESPRLTRGMIIDQYDVLEEIGHGGMGVIYKARHRDLKRIVALKMLRIGPWAAPADLQRFRTETDAVANLDHPHIVPIYDVGVFEGQPYFTMKLIEGGSLAHAGIRGQGSGVRETNGRWAAETVAVVARAVHYAHQRGILHRDIKPANILLDTERMPHITDFGLAKRLTREPVTTSLAAGPAAPSTADQAEPADGGLTQTGSILGTPSYMAPEQASGQKGLVTTAADVYSLGAVLYELLAGRPPFRGATPLETLRQLMEKEPEPLRAHHPDVERDLETICLKCLEKDPRQRYASALSLAEDLERFLAGRPIHARPVGNTERIWRWCRRQPALAAVSGLAAAAVLAVVAGLVYFAFNESRHVRELSQEKAQTQAALDEARLQTEEAERQRARAEDNFHLAHQAVHDFCVNVSEKLASVPSMQPLRKQLLESSLKYYQTFLERGGQNPTLRRELAETHKRAGDIISHIGSKSQALAEFEKGLAIYEDLLRDQPDDIALQEKAAWVRVSIGVHQPTVETALTVYQDTRVRAENLLRAHADHRGLRELAATLYNNLAIMHRKKGNVKEAESLLQQACDHQAELVKLAADNPMMEAKLALYINNMGILQNDLGKPDDALKSFQMALGIREALVKAHPREWSYQLDVSASSRDIGMILSNRGNQDEALKMFRKAQETRESLVQANPSMTKFQSDLAFSCRDVGEALLKQGKLDDALASYQRSRTLQQKLVQGNPNVAQYRFDLAQSYLKIGDVYQEKKHSTEALEAIQEARRMLDELIQAHPDNLDYPYVQGLNLERLGRTFKQLGRLDEAAAALDQAVARQRIAFEKAPQVRYYRKSLDKHYSFLADTYRAAGKADRAVQASLERRKLWEADSGELVTVARDLAKAIEAVGNGKPELSPEERAERRRYEDLVMDTLRQAAARGFKDGAALQKEKDLEPVRQRADFQELLRGLMK
jgi:serine/threonine protein kinase